MQEFHVHRRLLFLGFFGLLGFFGIFSIALAAVSSPQTLNDDLVGYWKFDETSAGSFADASGSNYTGTGAGASGANNTPQPSADVPSAMQFTNTRSVSFDGTDDAITLSDVPNPSYPLTIAFWAKSDSATPVGMFDSAPNTGDVIRNYPAGYVEWWSEEPSVELNMTADTWTHLAFIFTYDGTRHLAYYKDGVLQEVADGNNNSTLAWTSLRLGDINNGDAGRYSGELDDFRIYSRALSAGEIAELASGRHPSAVWDGSSDSNFFAASNWTGSTIPDPYTRVEITNNTNPVILTGAIQVSGLTIGTGSSLDLNGTGVTILESGSFTNYGTMRMVNDETLSGVTLNTDHGTVMIYGTGTITSLPFDSYHSLNLNDGLIAYWKLDETSGTRAADSSGYGNSGSIIDNPVMSTETAPTNFTNARSLKLQGTDYIAVGKPILPTDGSAWSVAFWTNWTSFLSNEYPMGQYKNGQAGRTVWYTWSAGSVYRFYNPGVGVMEFGSAGNEWTHLATVFDGTRVSLYRNGEFATSATGMDDVLSEDFLIGAGFDTDGSVFRHFQGFLDDIRIYNRAISPGEVSALAAGNQPSTALADITLDNNLSVAGNLTLNGGTLDVSSSNYTITVSGSWINQGGIFTARDGTVTLDGSDSGLQILSGGSRFDGLTVTQGGGSWTLQDRLTVSGALTISAGTLDTSSNDYTLKAGTLNHTAGTFQENNSSVILSSSKDSTLTTSATITNLRIEDPTETGLVGYWKFDEGTNTGAILDSSGNGNTGVRHGGEGLVWTGATISGFSSLDFDNPYVMSFDGSAYVTMGDREILEVEGDLPFSISIWYRPTSSPTAEETDVLVSKGLPSNEGYAFQYEKISGNFVINISKYGVIDQRVTIAELTTGQWHHLAAVQRATEIEYYVNGVSQGTYSNASAYNPSGTDEFRIGAVHDGGLKAEGLIDDVRIYNRALSAQEVQNLYQGRYANGGSETSTITLGANTTVTNLYLDSGTLSTSSYTLSVTNAFTLYSGQGSLTLGSAKTTFSSNLTLSGSTITGSSGNVAIGGNLSLLTGSFIAPSGTLTLSGSLLQTQASFTHNSGTLQLDGTSQALTGTLLLNNFTKTTSSTDTLTFGSGSSLAFSGALILRGAASNLLSIRTSPAGNLHFLNLDSAGSQTIDYLDVKDSDALSGATLTCDVNTEGCVNSGNNSNWSFGDLTAPTLSTLSPADDVTDIAITANLVITFNETIGKTGTGTVSIYKSSDDSLIETIAVTGSLVTGSGSTEITINPTDNLANSTSYYIQISANAFPDSVGNYYAGISDATTWNFTTVAAAASSSSSSSSEEETFGSSGGGGGGGRRHSQEQMAKLIADAHEFILARYNGALNTYAEASSSSTPSPRQLQLLAEKRKAEEQEELYQKAEQAREVRIALRIQEHQESVLALEQQKASLQEQLKTRREQRLAESDAQADSDEKTLNDLLTSVEERLTERTQELRREQIALKEEQEMNRKAREKRIAQLEQQHGAASSNSSKSSSSQNLERIGAVRDRLVATIQKTEVLFSDVITTQWYAPYVATLIFEGVAEGYKDQEGNLTGEFGIANPITRAEVLKMALQAAKLPSGQALPPPRNQSAQNTWASSYVSTAESLSLTVFTSDINVHIPATRGEVVQTVLEVMELPLNVQSDRIANIFTDLPESHPYYSAILSAYVFGIVNGDDGATTFRPDDPMNRAEVSKIIAVVREVVE